MFWLLSKKASGFIIFSFSLMMLINLSLHKMWLYFMCYLTHELNLRFSWWALAAYLSTSGGVGCTRDLMTVLSWLVTHNCFTLLWQTFSFSFTYWTCHQFRVTSSLNGFNCSYSPTLVLKISMFLYLFVWVW